MKLASSAVLQRERKFFSCQSHNTPRQYGRRKEGKSRPLFKFACLLLIKKTNIDDCFTSKGRRVRGCPAENNSSHNILQVSALWASIVFLIGLVRSDLAHGRPRRGQGVFEFCMRACRNYACARMCDVCMTHS